MTLPDFDPCPPEMPESAAGGGFAGYDDWKCTEPDDESGDPPWTAATAHPHPTKETP